MPYASLVAQTVKNPPANAENLGSVPGLGTSPGEGNGNPLQYSCLENAMDCSPPGSPTGGLPSMRSQRVDTTEQLTTFTNTVPLLVMWGDVILIHPHHSTICWDVFFCIWSLTVGLCRFLLQPPSCSGHWFSVSCPCGVEAYGISFCILHDLLGYGRRALWGCFTAAPWHRKNSVFASPDTRVWDKGLFCCQIFHICLRSCLLQRRDPFFKIPLTSKLS